MTTLQRQSTSLKPAVYPIGSATKARLIIQRLTGLLRYIPLLVYTLKVIRMNRFLPSVSSALLGTETSVFNPSSIEEGAIAFGVDDECQSRHSLECVSKLLFLCSQMSDTNLLGHCQE